MPLDQHKDRVIAEIRSFYGDGSSYGFLSQRLHGLQAAEQAKMAGAPVEVRRTRSSGLLFAANFPSPPLSPH